MAVWVYVLLKQFPTFSDVSDCDFEKHIYIEVWDWNRISRNHFMGSTNIKISDLVSETRDGQRVDAWYKLLEETQGRKQNEEAKKVSVCKTNSASNSN